MTKQEREAMIKQSIYRFNQLPEATQIQLITECTKTSENIVDLGVAVNNAYYKWRDSFMN